MVPPSIWHCPKFLIGGVLPFKITMINYNYDLKNVQKIFSPSAEFLMREGRVRRGVFIKAWKSSSVFVTNKFHPHLFCPLGSWKTKPPINCTPWCNVLVLFLFGILTLLKSILSFPYSPLPRQRCRGDGDHLKDFWSKSNFFAGIGEPKWWKQSTQMCDWD